jgi:hypothetical protein
MQVWERDGQKIYVQFSHKLILIGSAPLPISMAKETLNKPFRSDFLDHALAVAGSKVGASCSSPIRRWNHCYYCPSLLSAIYGICVSPTRPG